MACRWSTVAEFPAATNANLTVAATQLADAANYDVIVANNGGSVTSTVCTLTFTAPTGAGYEAAVIGSAPVAYWRLGEPNGSPYAFDFYGGYSGTYGSAAYPGTSGPQPTDFPGFETTNSAVQTYPEPTKPASPRRPCTSIPMLSRLRLDLPAGGHDHQCGGLGLPAAKLDCGPNSKQASQQVRPWSDDLERFWGEKRNFSAIFRGHFSRCGRFLAVRSSSSVDSKRFINYVQGFRGNSHSLV